MLLTDCLAGEPAEAAGDDGDVLRTEGYDNHPHGDDPLPDAEP